MPRISCTVFSIPSQEVRRKANDASTLNTKHGAHCTEVCGRDDAGAKGMQPLAFALYSRDDGREVFAREGRGGNEMVYAMERGAWNNAWIARAKLEIEWRTPKEWLCHSAARTGLFYRARVENGKTHVCARRGVRPKIGAARNKPRDIKSPTSALSAWDSHAWLEIRIYFSSH